MQRDSYRAKYDSNQVDRIARMRVRKRKHSNSGFRDSMDEVREPLKRGRRGRGSTRITITLRI